MKWVQLLLCHKTKPKQSKSKKQKLTNFQKRKKQLSATMENETEGSITKHVRHERYRVLLQSANTHLDFNRRLYCKDCENELVMDRMVSALLQNFQQIGFCFECFEHLRSKGELKESMVVENTPMYVLYVSIHFSYVFVTPFRGYGRINCPFLCIERYIIICQLYHALGVHMEYHWMGYHWDPIVRKNNS